MRKWLIDECNVKATSTDDEFKKAAGTALAAGTLTAEKLTELSTTKEDEEADDVVSLFKGISDTFKDISKSLKTDEKSGEAETKDGEEPDGEKSAKTTKPTGEKAKPSMLEKLFTRSAGPVDEDVDGEEKSFSVRIKEVAEQYTDTKSALTFPEYTDKGKAHPLAGKPVKDYSEGASRTIHEASDLDKAVAGAYGKFLVQTARLKSRSLAFAQLPQHDRELLCHAMEKMTWGGSSDGGDYADIKNRRLTPAEQKALIDDSTSGGLEAAPIVFDDMVIQTPLLNGELYPLVTQVPLDRGRRVEGVSVGNVTGSWGGVDDTAISLFNTASYVAAFDTTIFRWEGAIRLGLDFLSDTPIDFGPIITAQYGERLLEDLDDVIAVGNGTTQPEGIMTKSGTTSVSFGGATSIGNYESLRFGVPKKEHKANVKSSAVFVGTETSYQRVRAIPVGASDARRLGGMDYDSYSWMQRPYKINESLTNSQIFYAILARYRMYRRRGLSMRQSTEGDTLIRNNELLMVAMARYGGQLERGACAAVTSTAPA
jgi:HK97 family phage major capsid protein